MKINLLSSVPFCVQEYMRHRVGDEIKGPANANLKSVWGHNALMRRNLYEICHKATNKRVFKRYSMSR